jgi:ferritin-like metal-binding protein YciE
MQNIMTENNSTITNLHNLLDYEASKFTSAEIELKNSLPEWINKAGSLKFKTVLQKYLDFVQQHVQKLESFYEEEKIISLSLTNHVMQAFIAEAEEKLSYCTDAAIKDACLLASIQTINHFKISTYGTAAAFAKTLGMEKQAAIFHEAEVNEKQIDDRLSQLAEHEINILAKTPIELHE